MNDLISRQGAIDALKRDEALVRAFGYHNAIDAIRELPSAQPQSTIGQVNDTAQSTNDCISRQAAIDAINKYILSFDAIDANFLDGLKTAIKIIKENFPSAQPTIDPVKHGKWIPINERAAKCSLCGGWEYTNGIDKTGTAIIHRAIKHYCPNCGARME